MKKYAMITAFCLFATACNYDVGEKLYPTTTCDLSNVTFKVTVQPILAKSCVSCHANNFPQGGVSLEGYDNVALWAKRGTLYNSIAHNGMALPMPKGGAKLDDCSVASIKKWVDSGFPNN
jgi:hypothetical protein